MKYTNLRAFIKHLESAHPDHFAPVYLILSKDSFEAQSAVGQIHERISQKWPMKSFEPGCAAEEIESELNSFSMFSERKAVLVQQIDKASPQVKKFLEASIEKPVKGTVLVMTASSLAVSTKLYKSAEKNGVILNLGGSEKPWEREARMIEWAMEQAEAEGKELDQKAARALVARVGTDASMLHNELVKLGCYVGTSGQITPADIESVCPRVNQETGWKLGEAIFQLNAADSMRIGKELLKDQVPLIVLLRQIRKQFQTGYFVGSVLAGGADQAEITKAYPYMRGRILQQHVRMANSYGTKRFAEGLAAIDKTEVEAKNSGLADAVLLELLIARLTL